MQKYVICGKRILKKLSKSLTYQKVTDHCHYAAKYRGVSHSFCNLKINVPNEILVVFRNYHYLFIIEELANEFEGKFECLRENMKKYKTSSVPIEKEVTKTDKDDN